MSGAETSYVDEWIFDILTGDGTLAALISARCYVDLAPNNIPYPFIVYNTLTTQDKVGVGAGTRVFNKAEYCVRGVAEVPTYTALAPIAKRIDQLLDGVGDGGTLAGEVLAVSRTEEYRLTEDHEGRTIRHFGGIYSIWSQTT